MSATQQCANITFCALLHKSHSKALQMLEDANGEVAVKKMQIYNGRNIFM
jgi:hypothetical protein